ncbi:MAG: bifunctional heptose 7-phosphate kinase/heptose 1-phosphate adenyltransferase [Bacteroidales bacterium]|jgi:rfaE bifunctional protein kinase chain/domain|nr:D-glycero-beta-D-manno-heptose-7-phosphate kinase [Bacteroidales bacterium]
MTQEFIEELFESFNSKKVVIIGDVMVDAYLFGSVDRISPEAPVPVVNVKSRDNRPGGAANVALNVKALGAEAILCSVVGKDPKGKEFVAAMEAEGISTKGIVESENRVTTTKFRIFGNKIQMLRVDEETTKSLNKEDCENLYNTIEYILENEDIDAVIFEDYDKGVVSKELIEKVIFKTQILDIPVMVDPKKDNFQFYDKTTIFKPNLKELVEGTHAEVDVKNINELQQVVEQFIRKHQIEIVVTTLSERGVMVSWQDEDEYSINHQHIPAHIRNIADVSGAGDTVVSVLALCHASGLNPVQTASIANIAGGLVCEEVGVVPINKEKFLKEAKKLLIG